LGNANLANKLSSISKDIHQGHGIVVVRGLDAAKFNDEEAVVAFAGICSYVCPERATDSYANQTLSKSSPVLSTVWCANILPGHVRDATKETVPTWAKDIGLAGSKITAAMDFHSDRFSGDVLALHVRNDGGIGSGGEQYFASFWRIYNELLETDPEVLETMAEADWPFELKQKYVESLSTERVRLTIFQELGAIPRTWSDPLLLQGQAHVPTGQGATVGNALDSP
jgi:hypothetical protein